MIVQSGLLIAISAGLIYFVCARRLLSQLVGMLKAYCVTTSALTVLDTLHLVLSVLAVSPLCE